jgi:CDP-6-deoxy-D-xylo-4-hexulose-3-dehydrase
MSTPYALAADTFGDEEIAAAKAVLDSGRLTMGERVRGFEAEFAQWTGARHALMVNSGSSANLLMIEVMLRRSSGRGPWQPGDEVLVPALAWPTTVWPLVQLGLIPVFVDVDRTTLAIDLESAAAALGPRTRGMFLISVMGRAPDLAAHARFCEQHGLVLLEDACESLGAHSEQRHVGTFGTMASFSFYFSHHLSTIEGGAILTNDDALHDDLKSARAHGWIRDRSDAESWRSQFPSLDDRFLFITPGYNVRPMELQAAIGSVQLRKLDHMLAERERLARRVRAWLAEWAPWLELIGADCLSGDPAAVSRRARTNSWMTLPLRLGPRAPVAVRELQGRLEELGVATRPIIAGNLVRHPAVRAIEHRCAPSLAAADDTLARAFMIGCHPVLAPGALETLERAIRSLSALK